MAGVGERGRDPAPLQQLDERHPRDAGGCPRHRVAPHRRSQSTKACRSGVQVAKARTGAAPRAVGTPTTSSLVPMAMPAAWG
jgi:hypothetical protein